MKGGAILFTFGLLTIALIGAFTAFNLAVAKLLNSVTQLIKAWRRLKKRIK
ncbi:hypothetical protein FC83_GL002918 [Agrilactobacillus composti DSM 18527 = JCM 14202]|uniref:Uncharacterized protein n=1 Tax=Agrilactobacillus composti DSM 18527 = JCM 14202 TaxID=1423734 RepID=A0A0R1Y115_9LACO|nr:hypothetical protein FC83_GL002918 [Agrilactobacillus composti DSM 18527 = JCM 14202]